MKTSKNILLIALMFLVFEGCNKDDPGPDQSAELIGAWEAVSFVSSNCKDPSENGTTTCTSFCEILVFTSTTVTFDGDGPFNYTTSGNSLTIDFGGSQTGTYSISASTLTFTGQDSPADGGCKNVSTYKKAPIDIDGNVYHTVKIGTQIWMVENLNVTKYRNGDPIPNVTDGTQWKNSSTGAYCNYDNNAFSAEIYGRIYNWHSVNDSRKIAPEGWHVASDTEWTTLTSFLGGENVAGGKLKEAGLGLWQSPNEGATNESGFTALPGGTRYFDGAFDNQNGLLGYWWTSTQIDGTASWYRYLPWNDGNVHRFGHLFNSGFSVRCVKD